MSQVSTKTVAKGQRKQDEKTCKGESSSKRLTPNNDGLVPVPERLRKFAEKNQMKIVQINSQRIYGPSVHFREDWSPPKGSEIFVGKIARSMTEIELVPILEQSGRIFQLRLLMDFSGTNRGYCFVQYFHPQQADLAVLNLHRYQIRKGHRLVASKSVDNCKLMMKGMPMYKTNREMFHELSDFAGGVTGVAKKSSKGVKGTIEVTFINHKAAALARSKILAGGYYPWGYRIIVDWADPEDYYREYQYRQAGLETLY